MIELERLPSEKQTEFVHLVNSLNETLETAAQTSANHAFNVGCSVSLLPLLLLAVLVLILANWVSALIAGMVALLIALGLAALVAWTARKNAIEQTYRLRVAPEIERSLSTYQLSRLDFDRLADAVLPSGALLRNYLSLPEIEAVAGE
jgi:hypothetical protein